MQNKRKSMEFSKEIRCLTRDEDKMSEFVLELKLYIAAACYVVVQWFYVTRTSKVVTQRLNDALRRVIEKNAGNVSKAILSHWPALVTTTDILVTVYTHDKQGIMQQNNMLPANGSSTGTHRRCSNQANATKAAPTMALLPFRPLLWHADDWVRLPAWGFLLVNTVIKCTIFEL